MEFATPLETMTVVAYAPDPLVVWRTHNLDVNYGHRLDGESGTIPIGEKQSLKRTGWLPAQQAFVGAQQLLNLANAKVGLSTAIPSTKPNPGVVPLTAMQQQLQAMGTNGMR